MAAIEGAYTVEINGGTYDCWKVEKQKERDKQNQLTGWYIFSIWFSEDNYALYKAQAYWLNDRQIILGSAKLIRAACGDSYRRTA